MSVDVSIIIPTFNRLWSLPLAVESCMNTNCRTEIIVVDDGSTDGTAEWLKQKEGIIALHQNHLGKCWAVNKGFAVAKGKYIRFLDSDDMLAPGAIDEQFTKAIEKNCDLVVSGLADIDEQGNMLKKLFWTHCDDFIAQQLGECDGSHYSAFLFKKSFIEDIPHRPDFAFRDDRLFILETAIRNPKIAIHDGTALLHRIHNKSRLQLSSGLKYSVQNYQHLNIYKYIFMLLKQQGQLSSRRIDASMNVLWPLCHWIAKDNINEAADMLMWMREFKPGFKAPEQGLLGYLFNKLGFKTTQKILRLRRKMLLR